jgi:SNF2 family DNA or RNA helicase
MNIFIKEGRIHIPAADVMARFGRNAKPGMVGPVFKEALPGVSWSSLRQIWNIFATPDNVAMVNKIFKIDLTSPISDLKDLISTFPFKTKPRAHQLEALEACGCREYFAYFMEPGLGKTKTGIDDMQILNHNGKVDDVLVTCPKSIIGTWLRELHNHGHYRSWRVGYWDNDSGTPRLKIIYEPHKDEPVTMRWFIISIDSLLDGTAGWRAAYQFTMCTCNGAMMVDESTTIKNIEAKRTNQAMILGNHMRYRRILSGSPIANTPLDYFAQMTYLDPYIFHGWSYKAFRDHYAITGGYKQREIYGYCNQDELANIVAQHSIIKTKDECLDLPPRIYQIREITLTKQSKKAYDAMVNNLTSECEQILNSGVKLTVDTVTKKIMKLRQLVGGWVLGDMKENKTQDLIKIGAEKFTDLMDFMEECKAIKTIIWCQFTHEIHAIYEAMQSAGFHPVKYHGAMKTKERIDAENEFERGGANVAIIQNDTGAMGLTLNAASISYIYSNPSYPLPRIQLEERNYRDGQTKSTTIIDALVMGTVDEALYHSLMDRKTFNSKISDAIKSKDFSKLKGIFYPKKLGQGWNRPQTEREE